MTADRSPHEHDGTTEAEAVKRQLIDAVRAQLDEIERHAGDHEQNERSSRPKASS